MVDDGEWQIYWLIVRKNKQKSWLMVNGRSGSTATNLTSDKPRKSWGGCSSTSLQLHNSKDIIILGTQTPILDHKSNRALSAKRFSRLALIDDKQEYPQPNIPSKAGDRNPAALLG